MQHLQPNTLLQGGKYKIERVLGQGGFGITYLALQRGLERKVAIKEFFMKELCDRDENTSHVTLGTTGSRETVNRFRDKFLKEARNIAKLNHPNIVRVIDVFEENDTAYYVMEYAENGSLADKVAREGYLSEKVATRYILQVAEALEYIHQRKMNHLDIKPGNIMLNEKDEAVLIDFGLSKQYDAVTGNQTSTTPVGISEGYAPMEQYMQGGVGAFSPETDIYSLGATFYKLLTGVTPPNASLVNNEGLSIDELNDKGVSDKAVFVITQAMEGRKKDRTKSVRSFIDSVNVTISSPTHSSTPDDDATILTMGKQRAKEDHSEDETECVIREKKEKRKPTRKRRKRVCQKTAWIGIFAIVVVLLGIVFSVISNSSTTETFTVNGVSFDMVKVRAGTFTMGGSEEGDGAPHQVTLTNNYYIGETEVTQALWKAVMGNNPSNFKGDNLPVECVSWEDCRKFISKLNTMTKQNFRLPTEAEWEFAARGGNKSNQYRYSGSNNLDAVAWYNSNSGETTHVVATKQPNELGIYDMSGNVCEWCSDYFENSSYNSQTNPTGPSCGDSRVFRDGSCFDLDWYCRLSLRSGCSPNNYGASRGFRLALSK